jgi:hypothetical protein
MPAPTAAAAPTTNAVCGRWVAKALEQRRKCGDGTVHQAEQRGLDDLQ